MKGCTACTDLTGVCTAVAQYYALQSDGTILCQTDARRDSEAGTCVACPDNCAKCTDAGVCEKCNGDEPLLPAKTCCGPGKYSGTDYKCKDLADKNCLNGWNTAGKCTEC